MMHKAVEKQLTSNCKSLVISFIIWQLIRTDFSATWLANSRSVWHDTNHLFQFLQKIVHFSSFCCSGVVNSQNSIKFYPVLFSDTLTPHKQFVNWLESHTKQWVRLSRKSFLFKKWWWLTMVAPVQSFITKLAHDWRNKSFNQDICFIIEGRGSLPPLRVKEPCCVHLNFRWKYRYKLHLLGWTQQF